MAVPLDRRKPYLEALNEKWDDMIQYYSERPDQLLLPISAWRDTALHMAVHSKKEWPLKDLLDILDTFCEMTPGESNLMTTNAFGNTALHEAVTAENLEAVKLLAPSYPVLTFTQNDSGETPLFKAASLGYTHIVKYLAALENMLSQEHHQRHDSMSILHVAVAAEHFETALQLLKLDKSLAELKNSANMTALHLLANMPYAFESGYSKGMGVFDQFIYFCLPVEDDDDDDYDDDKKADDFAAHSRRFKDLESAHRSNQNNNLHEGLKQIGLLVCKFFFKVLKRMWLLICRFFFEGWPIVEGIWSEKRKHVSAARLAKLQIKYDNSLNQLQAVASASPDYAQGVRRTVENVETHNLLVTPTSTEFMKIVREILEKYPQAVEHVIRAICDNYPQAVDLLNNTQSEVKGGQEENLPGRKASIRIASTRIMEIVHEILDKYPQAVEHLICEIFEEYPKAVDNLKDKAKEGEETKRQIEKVNARSQSFHIATRTRIMEIVRERLENNPQDTYQKAKHLIHKIFEKYPQAVEHLNDMQKQQGGRQHPLFMAASTGIIEIVREILEKHPQAVEHVNYMGQNILHVAIMHRQKEIFHFVKGKRIPFDRMIRQVDKMGYTLLHHAADTKHYTGGSAIGPVLKLQDELRWFRRVQKVIPSYYVMHRENKKKMTAEELFNEKHKKQLKQAQTWIKATSQSCSTVAALVSTLVFAAAYAIPGGSEKGIPIFIHSPYFLLFTVMDVVALASSLTSVVMFLSILTSPFEFQNFRDSLPRRLTFGFTSLFFSLVTTMLAFGATILLVIRSESKWTTSLISIAAFFPVSVFAVLQFRTHLAFMGTMKDVCKIISKSLDCLCSPCMFRFKKQR